jgi:3-methylcrotonyl-CoA carboxylase alpha subunit
VLKSVLVANRGEIACRVLRTVAKLGLRSIAIYSDADARAQHVLLADSALRVGGPAARDSYLDIGAIIDAARRSGAEAIHPGYGFLSENADFAGACEEAGIVFIGPPAAAMRAMGSKMAAKRLLESSGVPLVPGYHGESQDADRLASEAERIGYPILIKASAGGGGKGMRIVRQPDQFQAALEGARRESLKAFADDRVLLEHYLPRPRHVEIQVFADNHGHCIHLHERDCSVQRRHQKILEEAPAPGVSAAMRAQMGAAAVAVARTVGYRGAGTVEFIVSDGEFHFLEMNTRLQVEHPVTEMITGLDLVEWQILIAAGAPLPLSQADVPLNGHAFEARIYAEDPAREFLPSTGRIVHLRWPDGERAVRIDAGVRQGDEVSIHYDPLLAKVIVHGADREGALRLLQHALARCEIIGVTTNLPLLRSVSAHPQFQAARVDTGFIAAHEAELFVGQDGAADARAAILAAIGWLLNSEAADARGAWGGPWSTYAGWRANASPKIECRLRDRDQLIAVSLTQIADGSWRAHAKDTTLSVDAHFDAVDELAARVDGQAIRVRWLRHGGRISVIDGGRAVTFEWEDAVTGASHDAHAGELASPMPGHVLQVLVKRGEAVRRGQPLMIVEAMKMEHTVTAHADGVVAAIHFATGDKVEEGAVLLDFEPNVRT